MADTKSISRETKRLAAKLPKGMTPQQLKDAAGDPDEMVEVPFLRGPYRKAPEVDPYLKAETVSWVAAGSVDTDLSFLSFLELYGTEIAERRMPARRVVEALDVVEHI